MCHDAQTFWDEMRHKEEYRVFEKKAVLLWSYTYCIVTDLLIGTKNIPWRSESKNHLSASINCTIQMYCKWVLSLFQHDCRSAWELCVKLRIFVGRWFLDPEEGTAQIIKPAQSARAWRACALRALGLLLADGTPTVGGGKTFWAVSQIFLRKQL